MKVKDANSKLCPFTDTKYFHGHEVDFCICELCMGWIYTDEYSTDDSRRNVELKTNEKEGYCGLVGIKI